MKIAAGFLVIAATFLFPAPARAQDDKEALKKKLLEQIEKKLEEESKRILEEISKLIDDEIAKMRAKKPPSDAPATPPVATGRPGYLGVGPDQEQPEEEDFKAWKVEGGVRVMVAPDEPADKAGLKEGDVIIEANGKKVREWSELPESLKSTKPGDKVKIKFLRGKETREATVTLGIHPDARPKDSAPPPAEPPKASTKPGKLGIYPGDATGKGMAVESVGPGSPAQKAGIKTGDILKKLDETAIWKESDLAAFMKGTKPGQKVEVTVLRDGEEKKFSVVLAEP
jgi:S1-C subfamily serine protease